ncbi:uncharacterized protein F4822DRAFT_274490 [Hypoxylon trugodes]|uniref:uncharacterized protein n=1 Tax=Hypoxylon trugodes TaxID=326681 RepID=UPI00219FAFA1|nr:uncharacterized protein F4822DRAFT_274490 [Hypoxylon trugodes]KAI1387120.1 hypothetical protein F4822DRAFT_274490 [Hypoxylon trugodes]
MATTNVKPGKSKHPYDTGAGETTGRTTENELPRDSSRQTGRIAPREGKSRKSRTLPILSPRQGEILVPPSQTSDYTPGSRTVDDSLRRPKIKFRSILGLQRNRKNIPNAVSLNTISASPARVSPELEAQLRDQQQTWWPLKKVRGACGERDGDDIFGLAGEESMLDAENGLATSARSRTMDEGVQSHHASPSSKNEIEKKANIFGRTRLKLENRIGQKQRSHKGLKRTENDDSTLQTDWEQLETSGPKPKKWRAKSKSSSQTRSATAGASSTPGNTTIHADFTCGESEGRTRSLTPTQAFRLLLGLRKTPSSATTTTQPDLGGSGIRESATTLLRTQPSQESRYSNRQSTEVNKSRAWIPFWGLPRPQPKVSPGIDIEDASRRGSGLEPASREMGQSGLVSPKKYSGRISRRGWRSG